MIYSAAQLSALLRVLFTYTTNTTNTTNTTTNNTPLFDGHFQGYRTEISIRSLVSMCCADIKLEDMLVSASQRLELVRTLNPALLRVLAGVAVPTIRQPHVFVAMLDAFKGTEFEMIKDIALVMKLAALYLQGLSENANHKTVFNVEALATITKIVTAYFKTVYEHTRMAQHVAYACADEILVVDTCEDMLVLLQQAEATGRTFSATPVTTSA